MCSRIKWIIHANWINPTWGSHFAHRRVRSVVLKTCSESGFAWIFTRAITIATENRAENHQHVRYILKLLHSISSQVALRFCAFCHSCSWDHMSKRSHVVIALDWVKKYNIDFAFFAVNSLVVASHLSRRCVECAMRELCAHERVRQLKISSGEYRWPTGVIDWACY